MTLKYSNSEALNEVLARRDLVRRKRERRRTVWYGVSVCAILVALTLTAASLPTGAQSPSGMENMGSFLLEAKSGGILAALILAFVLGVLGVLLFLRRRKPFRKPEAPKEPPEESKNHENGGTIT